MKLEDLFGKTRAHWVKYSEYEYQQDKKSGQLFITPSQSAKMGGIYNPIEIADKLVVDGINAGLACMSESKNEEQKKQAVLGFVNQYGLPGFMTALPTTPDFMDFDVVYLPKNPCIETDTMPCLEYIELFFPFEKLNIVKNENSVSWTASGNEAVALQMTMNNVPLAASLTYHRTYSEPYEWVKAELKNWAFMLMTSVYFYKEKDKTMRELYQKGLYAFGGIAPGYHIILEEDKPIIVWDFQALMRVVQMAISYAMTNENMPLRVCKGCQKAFIAQNPKQLYCSPKCKDKDGK